MMIETLESRQFCSVSPLAAGAPAASPTASRIVVVQPSTTPPPPSPNVLISIIGILVG